MNAIAGCMLLLHLLVLSNFLVPCHSRKHRSVIYNKHVLDLEGNELERKAPGNSIDFIWYTQTVAAGDTAVLHCSFDAIFSQLRNGNIDWSREKSAKDADAEPLLIAEGKKVLIDDRRYRVYRPHNSALSVLIVRRAKKRDAGIYRCNLSGSSTRQKYMALNVTESKIEAQTSPPKVKTQIGKDITMWCNATGYPKPVVYWTREDSNRKLQDGSYQYWGNGLHLHRPTEEDTGIYACYLDNFVQPVVSYLFSLSVEDKPWSVHGYKMRFDSTQWYPASNPEPVPVRGMSYLLMCETNGSPKPLPKIKWLRDGRPITNTKHFYIIEDRPDWRTGYTSSTLVIMRFVPRFQANYTCVGTNIFREKSQTFYVHRYLEKVGPTPSPTVKSTSFVNSIDQLPATVTANDNKRVDVTARIGDVNGGGGGDDDDDVFDEGSAAGQEEDITNDTEDDSDEDDLTDAGDRDVSSHVTAAGRSNEAEKRELRRKMAQINAAAAEQDDDFAEGIGYRKYDKLGN